MPRVRRASSTSDKASLRPRDPFRFGRIEERRPPKRAASLNPALALVQGRRPWARASFLARQSLKDRPIGAIRRRRVGTARGAAGARRRAPRFVKFAEAELRAEDSTWPRCRWNSESRSSEMAGDQRERSVFGLRSSVFGLRTCHLLFPSLRSSNRLASSNLGLRCEAGQNREADTETSRTSENPWRGSAADPVLSKVTISCRKISSRSAQSPSRNGREEDDCDTAPTIIQLLSPLANVAREIIVFITRPPSGGRRRR
ncbi:hypothetical protein KM043_000921 [Ampulex compressa]|nr:hypothetical protein KM043_000921 [Ampulex compressa]